MGGSSSQYITTLLGIGEHRPCDSGDILFLICNVTSLGHIFKGLCEFMGESLSRRVTPFPCLAAIDLVQVEI